MVIPVEGISMRTLVCALVCGAAASSALASVSLSTNRGDMGGGEYVNWGTYGGSGTPIANGASTTSSTSRGITVSTGSGGGMELVAGFGWAGGFTNGDNLIWTLSESNNFLVIDFATPVSGAGMQIWRNFPNGGTVNIEAFDSSNTSLGSGNAGTGGGAAPNNNQATFIGLISTSADISRLVFTMTNGGSFAGNQLDIMGGHVVPLPTGAFAGIAGLGLVAAVRRRKA